MSLTSFANAPKRNVFSRYHTLANTAQLRSFHCSIQTAIDPVPSNNSSTLVRKIRNQLYEHSSAPSFSLFQAIRDSRPAVRYTVYAGLGLMATVESTFWFHVIRAKFFPSTSAEEQEKNDQSLGYVRAAIAGCKSNWMKNHGRYYGGYVWGVGER